jgi:hypothetical protein
MNNRRGSVETQMHFEVQKRSVQQKSTPFLFHKVGSKSIWKKVLDQGSSLRAVPKFLRGYQNDCWGGVELRIMVTSYSGSGSLQQVRAPGMSANERRKPIVWSTLAETE